MRRPATEITAQKGVVALLDILGYGQFLNHNEPEAAARVVVDVLAKAPAAAKQQLLKHGVGAKPQEKVKKYLDKTLRSLVYSDSILIAFAYPNNLEKKDKRACWIVCLYIVIAIYRYMFDQGLPVRGAISFGDYFLEGNRFAGRCIIKAHELASKLDLAAVVIDDLSSEEMKSSGASESVDRIITPYLVPFRDGQVKRMAVLLPSLPTCRFGDTDIRLLVAESFLKHNKYIPPAVMGKLDNTEVFFRFIRTKHPETF